MVPLPLAKAADIALNGLRALAPRAPLPLSGAALLGERTRLMGLSRNGRASPTGHCRLIDCYDGRIALNLAREDDWGLLPALVGADAKDWGKLDVACLEFSAADLEQRGAEMGMAIARDRISKPRDWLRKQGLGEPTTPNRNPLLLDLSALWAGPLAASLLGMCGAQVVKVESLQRPDGARQGNAEFYELLNSGKRSVALDFAAPTGRQALMRLIEAADIIIEGSRPRALRQLGIEAEKLIAAKPGKVWLRMLAYGDDETRIGFGDDIGVAAGLPSVMEQAWGEPLMVGDAIADPLSGLHGALAAWQSWANGGGELLTLSMRDVVRHAMGDMEGIDIPSRAREWAEIAAASDLPFYENRTVTKRAEPLGHSTNAVLETLC